ncbi:GntR family transcriptional regulator [Subtercola lobariae]|uniref:GntR family transcriptional regulator n=1 Tax=Subtercola lobariae TaxID=1588641 RepID=A0A917B2W4_9MICO|nr:GntR family transcriptional regulator [Subtercola lobariae]GGF14717.1 GntR family transcriptional regulator [Subtercola lobariae]
MTPSVQPIDSRSVTELVTNELRRSIVSGDLAPGATFSLREIADLLNVSFIPVREALRNLEGEGLVITNPGKSARVAPLDLEDLHAIYTLRGYLEPQIARASCLLITDSELDRLYEQTQHFGDPTHTIDTVYESHHAFHADLLAPAATTWDMRTLNSLWRAAERYIRIGFKKAVPDPEENLRRQREHEHLVVTFRLRDPDAAAAAVARHLSLNEATAQRGLAAYTETV